VQRKKLERRRFTNPESVNIDLASPTELKGVPKRSMIVLEARRKTPDLLDGYSQMDDLFKQAEELRLTDDSAPPSPVRLPVEKVSTPAKVPRFPLKNFLKAMTPGEEEIILDRYSRKLNNSGQKDAPTTTTLDLLDSEPALTPQDDNIERAKQTFLKSGGSSIIIASPVPYTEDMRSPDSFTRLRKSELASGESKRANDVEKE
jgi:hypothetical protein